MDLSEGSNDSKPESKETLSRRSRERDSRDRRDRDRDSRESRERDRSRYEKDRRGSRDTERSDKSRSDYRRDRDRDRRRRSSSREKRRSRTPPKRADRELKHSRSRSKSRDRSRKYTKRYDRGSKGREEKIDQQKIAEDDKQSNPGDGNRFFMPGITGRFRDQIERRKQLWQKKDVTVDNKNGQTKKVWETTTFAQDVDGKVANKFKRLMGIRNTSEAGGQSTDVLKKQEEMFSSMEQQYEVARTATHTMRGVGLGFGSYQR